MVDFLSDHYGDGQNVVSPVAAKALDVAHRVDPGIGHGRRRYKRAQANATLLTATADTLRMMTFKSNDRIIDLLLTMEAGGAGALLDVGLALTGNRHDGALVDLDLFAADQDVALAQDRTNIYQGTGTTVTDLLRGLPLWQVADAGAATYSVDPQLQFDIIFTCGAVNIDNAEYILEALYVSGD
jgi:hypothetical protein